MRSLNLMSIEFNKMEFSRQRENPALRVFLTVFCMLLWLETRIFAQYENRLLIPRQCPTFYRLWNDPCFTPQGIPKWHQYIKLVHSLQRHFLIAISSQKSNCWRYDAIQFNCWDKWQTKNNVPLHCWDAY